MFKAQYIAKLMLFFMAVILSVSALSQSTARSSLASSALDNGSLVGSAVYGVGFRNFYEISLYREDIPEGRDSRRTPYALEISYLRDHTDDTVVDRIISQIRVSGYTSEIRLAQWHTQLVNMLPDLPSGSELAVIFNQTRETHFYLDGFHIGQIKDPAFGWRFMEIWLGEDTSESRIRDDLIGGSESANPLNEAPDM